MTRWIEADDPTLPEWEDHTWMKPAPEDCPNCLCHTARVCEGRLWDYARVEGLFDVPPHLIEQNMTCPCRGE